MNNPAWLASLSTLARIAAILCCLLTAGALIRIDVLKFPDRPVPAYIIRLAAPSLSSQEVDESVTLPVEAAVRSLDDSLRITSESRPGLATITVETTDVLASGYRERLERRLEEVSGQLPIQEWSINQENLADQRIGYFLLHGADVQTLSDAARHTVYEKLISLPGVARLDIEESVARQEVEIVFRPSVLLSYGLTPGDVLEQLPVDVAAEEVGRIGRGPDQTTIHWYSQTEGPSGLGRQMILTEKGYVSLQTLAEIRDLRGTKGEEIPVYRGEPALGITVYAAESGQLPAIRAQVIAALEEVNQAANGGYRMVLFADHAAPLTGAMAQLASLVVLAALVCAILIGLTQKSKTAAVLSLGAVLLATGTLLGGMRLAGIPLTLSSLGPLTLFSLLYIGAGPALFMRFMRLRNPTPLFCLRQAWLLMKALLLTVLVLAAGWYGMVATDYLAASDRSSLLDAGPVFLFGTLSLLLVYAFLVPVLAGTWMTPKSERDAGEAVHSVRKQGTKAAGSLLPWWERTVKKGFLPYAVLLAASLVCSLLFHPFLYVDPYGEAAADETILSLAMVQGSRIDDAIRAAQIAEERLRGIAEVRDMYTVATRERLTFHLLLHDVSDWKRSQYELEREMEQQLREVPGTDPYALVVNDQHRLRLEFTVKGPSRQTTEEIAKEVLSLLQQVKSRDNDGRENVTDERIGEGRTGTYVNIRPKPEMLIRYRIPEAEIKRQLASYLGTQSAGSVNWNGRKVAVQARFPEAWMEHEDQVKNILIRTPEGTVRLTDLVDWSYGTQPPVYKREDGLYVMQVSSAVSIPGRIESLAYVLPLRMKEDMTIPDGYLILNADELEKLTKAEDSRTDRSTRMLVISGLAACVVLAGVLLRGRLRDGLFALALLPLMAGAAVLGLMVTDRPMNLMGFSGIAAAIGIMVQQSLIHLDEMAQLRSGKKEIWEELASGSANGMASLLSVFAAVALACLPLTAGWLAGGGYVASFTSTLFVGTLLAAYSAIVLVPGMQYATEWRQAGKAEGTLPSLLNKLRVWRENERVRRQDHRESMRKLKKQGREAEAKEAWPGTPRGREELSGEDFLPLSPPKQGRVQHTDQG